MTIGGPEPSAPTPRWLRYRGRRVLPPEQAAIALKVWVGQHSINAEQECRHDSLDVDRHDRIPSHQSRRSVELAPHRLYLFASRCRRIFVDERICRNACDNPIQGFPLGIRECAALDDSGDCPCGVVARVCPENRRELPCRTAVVSSGVPCIRCADGIFFGRSDRKICQE